MSTLNPQRENYIFKVNEMYVNSVIYLISCYTLCVYALKRFYYVRAWFYFTQVTFRILDCIKEIRFRFCMFSSGATTSGHRYK